MAQAKARAAATLTAKIRRRLAYYFPTAAIAVGVILLWEFVVLVFDIQQFLLPKPSAIFAEFMLQVDLWLAPGERSILFESSGATFWEAFGGFIIGCGGGILVALITSRWTIISEATMPFAIAANSVPIIAFAPIMNNWFGIDNPFSKMAIVTIMIFFPIMINTVRGLVSVDARSLELMRSYAASDSEILIKLRIPNALPSLFSGLKVAGALAMIGAIVGEYFGGPRIALGVFITQEAALFRFASAWAAILVACLIGIGIYLVILLAERLALPWHPTFRA